jgi:S1-C subfamily serine protease
MKRLRWLFVAGVLSSLACALGPDEPAESRSLTRTVEGPPIQVRPDAGPRGARVGKGKVQRKTAAEKSAPSAAPEDSPSTVPAAEPDPPADASPSGAPPPGIQALGNNKWSVERRLVRQWESEPRTFAKARAKGKGWALQGVASRDARHLGFQEGDVILTVNDYPLASEAQAATAYGLVRNKKRWVVTLKRDGVRRTHTISVVD